MLAMETGHQAQRSDSLTKKYSSIWRRFSRRESRNGATGTGAGQGTRPPKPQIQSNGLHTHTHTENLRPQRSATTKLRKRPHISDPIKMSSRPQISEPITISNRPQISEPIKMSNKVIIAHWQDFDVPHQRSEMRATASYMQTTPFPKNQRDVQTVAWNVYLDPKQVYNLFMGFRPQRMEEKWFIYSEGPDHSGKLKVHFHRSWTGHKIAELFVLIDLKGEGAGKIVGIKWNRSEQTNGMDEEEAKYMVSTTCAWVLEVKLENTLL